MVFIFDNDSSVWMSIYWKWQDAKEMATIIGNEKKEAEYLRNNKKHCTQKYDMWLTCTKKRREENYDTSSTMQEQKWDFMAKRRIIINRKIIKDSLGQKVENARKLWMHSHSPARPGHRCGWDNRSRMQWFPAARECAFARQGWPALEWMSERWNGLKICRIGPVVCQTFKGFRLLCTKKWEKKTQKSKQNGTNKFFSLSNANFKRRHM